VFFELLDLENSIENYKSKYYLTIKKEITELAQYFEELKKEKEDEINARLQTTSFVAVK
jgi:hypothetical protein